MVTNRYIGGGNDQVGTIIQYFGSNPPKGFLSCDGSIYNIVDYSRLANHIEVEFGSKNFFGGDGTTTFAVPDLRGEFLRGTGTNGATEISGSNVGYHQDATKHVNIVVNREGDSTYFVACADVGIPSIVSSDSSIPTNNGKNGWVKNVDSYDATKDSHTWSRADGTNTTKETPYYTSRPTNTSVLFCIRW